MYMHVLSLMLLSNQIYYHGGGMGGGDHGVTVTCLGSHPTNMLQSQMKVEHLPFGLMLLCLGNVTYICVIILCVHKRLLHSQALPLHPAMVQRRARERDYTKGSEALNCCFHFQSHFSSVGCVCIPLLGDLVQLCLLQLIKVWILYT